MSLLNRDAWIRSLIQAISNQQDSIEKRVASLPKGISPTLIERHLAKGTIPFAWAPKKKKPSGPLIPRSRFVIPPKIVITSKLTARSEATRKATSKEIDLLKSWLDILQRRTLLAEQMSSLRQELGSVSSDELSEAHRRARHWISEAPSSRVLEKLSQQDPVNRIMRRTASLSSTHAQRIFASRTLPLDSLDDLEGPDHMLRDLLYGGLSAKPVPTPKGLGVLLPLQIETRFDEHESGWRLRLRVVPDVIALNNHDPRPSRAQWQALRDFWDVLGDSNDRNLTQDAFADLATQVGPERAAFLTRTYRHDEHATEEPETWREDTFPSATLHGLPDHLEVWLARRGGEATRAAIMTLDRRTIRHTNLEQDYQGDQRHWWNSFTIAEQVGLATTIELGEHAHDIDALYVVGLSHERPEALFLSHRDEGDLACLNLGDPTNTLAGAPASPLDMPASTWWELNQRSITLRERHLSTYLTGDVTLDRIPGGDGEPSGIDSHLIGALWPSLWGHTLRDILGLGDDADQAMKWARKHVHPEGLTVPIRVRDQPYGVLFASSMQRWEPMGKEPLAESALRPHLPGVLKTWAALSEELGSIEGANTERLLDILGRTASTDRFAWRKTMSLETIYLVLWTAARGGSQEDILTWWDEAASEIQDLPIDPKRKHISVLWAIDLNLPLVEADNLLDGSTWKDSIAAIFELIDKIEVWAGTSPELNNTVAHRQTELPQRLKLSALAEHMLEHPPNSLLLRLLFASMLRARADTYREARGDAAGRGLEPLFSPSTQRTRLEHDASMPRLPEVGGSAQKLEQLLRQDATHLAAQDLKHLERAFRAVLDAASWRIDPWITAFAHRRAQILGEKLTRRALGWYGWVDRPRPGGAGPTKAGLLHAPSEAQAMTAAILRDKAIQPESSTKWKMNLDSRQLRTAEFFAQAMKEGIPLAEAMGRHLEGTIRDNLADPEPVIDTLRDAYPLGSDTRKRRTCNGLAVIWGGLDKSIIPNEVIPYARDLQKAIDTYGDLLMAQMVHNVVSGRAAIAGSAADAAAGLRTPPSLEVIHTPRQGRTVATLVLGALASVEAPHLSEYTSPTTLADPAVAAWIIQASGPAKTWIWNVKGPHGTREVNLGDLGLTPADALSHGIDGLSSLIAEHIAPVLDDTIARELHTRARHALHTLGSTPTLPSRLDPNNDDTQSLADLQNRALALFQAATLARDHLAKVSTDKPNLRDYSVLWRWGIVGEDNSQEVGTRFSQGAAEIQGRLSAALDGAAHATAAVSAKTSDELAQVMANLATPEGQWPILARMPSTLLRQGLHPEPLASLQEEWLPVVAPVRPTLSTLECQLLGHLLDPKAPVIKLYCDRPKDPWQLHPEQDQWGALQDSRLTVVATPSAALEAQWVHVGVIDVFSEVVPSQEQDTSVAFGFNGPRARPPQAVLVAVPPRAHARLEGEDLVAILKEVRLMARARAMEARGLGGLAAILPTTFFPASGTFGAVNLKKEH